MTNEEAISLLRQVKEAILNSNSWDETTNEPITDSFDMAIKALEERKTGRWIFGETMGHSWMKCSECCKSQDGQTLCFTYCPNCGAKMEGSEEE